MSRPPIYDERHWLQVAIAYREGYWNGTKPTQYVAKHFSVSHTTATKWIAKCRELGMLPQTTRGRARSV